MSYVECATNIIVAMINNDCLRTPEQVTEAYEKIYNTITIKR